METLGDMLKGKLAKNVQIGGDHYKASSIEPWDVFLDWKLDPWLCNVIKYVQRHDKKNGLEDLKKAQHYLNFVIENYDQVVDKFYSKQYHISVTFKGERMYIVKLNNRKLTMKLFKDGFKTYESARQTLRKLLRSKGVNAVSYSSLGYSISKA